MQERLQCSAVQRALDMDISIFSYIYGGGAARKREYITCFPHVRLNWSCNYSHVLLEIAKLPASSSLARSCIYLLSLSLSCFPRTQWEGNKTEIRYDTADTPLWPVITFSRRTHALRERERARDCTDDVISLYIYIYESRYIGTCCCARRMPIYTSIISFRFQSFYNILASLHLVLFWYFHADIYIYIYIMRIYRTAARLAFHYFNARRALFRNFNATLCKRLYIITYIKVDLRVRIRYIIRGLGAVARMNEY